VKDVVNESFFTSQHVAVSGPQFDQIEVQHYRPAFDEGVRQKRAEIEAIVQNPQPLILPIRCWRLNKAALC
jgi:peptidyl-dipeptidase Dcp